MPVNVTSRKITILILAHNEASVISNTVSAILADLNPKDALLVVADNCNDETALNASKAGAQVYIRSSGNPDGKGKALAWFMREHAAALAGTDLLVILDADSKVKSGFSRIIKETIPLERSAFQCHLHPVSTDQSPVGKLAALSELLDQNLSDRLRNRLGFPVRLRGTGMVLAPDLLAAFSDQLETEVEDIALTLLLAASGVPIHRIDQAVVFDQKPGSSGAAAEQRARWFRGQMLALWHYRRQIFKLALKGPSGWALLSSLFLRPKWLILAIELTLALLLLHWPVASVLFFFLGGLSLAYYLVGLFLIPERDIYLRALLFTPAFIWMWMRSLFLALRSSSWRRSRK